MTTNRNLACLALTFCCVACGARADVAADSSRAPASPPRDTSVMAILPAGDTVELSMAAELRRINAELAGGTRTSGMFRNHPGVQVLESRRVENGVPEVHDAWMDATLVQAGHATLLSGGRLSGSALRSPGEHRGGTITGGTTRPLGEGDFLLVPAGVPHQFLVQRGDSIRYLTIKVPRAKTP